MPDTSGVDTLRSAWVDAFNAGDMATLRTLYTDDAVVMPEYQPPVTGPDAIVNMYEQMTMQATPHITLSPSETEVAGDWAYDRGQFTMTMTPRAEGASPMTENGSYLVILRRQADGTWKLAREIGNSNVPPPGMSGMPGMPGMSNSGDMPAKKM
jgi:uncharacterized protein (TIGR02246 family)